MTTYFLSYARADGRVALRFADALIAGGVSVWVDQYDIRPSQHWDRAVETAVRACQGMIVMLSPRSAASPNVADEVAVAIGEAKQIIPILIEKCTVPLRMTRMQFIDATVDPEAALAKCLAIIGGTTSAGERTVPPDTRLAATVLANAERRLIGLIGPISTVLVRQAAGRATSEAELYEHLARSIADPADRESFLGWVAHGPSARPAPSGSPAGGEIDAADAAAVAAALVRHLGPIAPHLVNRERASAASRQDLCERLAARIPDESGRAAFLKEVGP